MNKLFVICSFFFFVLSAEAQYKKAATIKNDDVWFYSGLGSYRYLLDIDKSNGSIDVYSQSDYTILATFSPDLPSGYKFDTLQFISQDIDNTSSGEEFGYITKSSNGSTIGVICDFDGDELVRFSDAIKMRSITRGTEKHLAITKEKSGKTTTELYSYGPNFTFQASYPTGNLKYDGSSEYGKFYYVDQSAKKVQIYNYQHKFVYDIDITVPSGYTLSTGLALLGDHELNNDSYEEFGVFMNNGSTYITKIVNERFELQLYTGVNGTKFYEDIDGTNLLALRYYTTGKPKWEIHKVDNKKSTNTTSLWVSHVGEPYFSEYYDVGLVFDEDSMSFFKYEYLLKQNRFTVKTGLSTSNEIINWTAYYLGIGDADMGNTELYYLWKSSTGKYTFNIKRSDGTMLLTVNNARKFRLGNLWREFSSVLVQVPGVGVEIYHYDYSLKAPNRISPVHKTKQLDFKSASFSWNSVKNATGYSLQIYEDTTSGSFWEQSVFDTSKVLTNELDSATTYYWRVFANNYQTSSPATPFYRFRTTDAGDLDAPTLLSPKDDAIDLDISTDITWEKVDDADSYEFQYSEMSDFSTSTQGIVNGTSKQLTPLKYNTEYFWRVRSKRGTILSNWSAEWSFTTQQKPTIDAPLLTSPTNGSLNVSTAPSLVWQSVSGATGYTYEYASKSDFSDAQSNTSSNTSVSLSGLANQTTYYWRVKTEKSGEFSSWSQPWSFTTEQKSLIDAPVLASPANGSLNNGTNTILVWQSVASATGYTYEYASKLDFSDGQLNTSLTTSASLSGLNNSTTYYWRVKTEQSGDFSNWSQVWSFTTVEPGTLVKPTLLLPSNKANGVNPSKAVLEWNMVANAETYEVQLSTDLNFATFSTGTPTGTTIEFTDLKEMTDYYWRVKAVKGGNESEWSDIWIFTTDIVKNVDERISSPAFVVYPNPARHSLNVTFSNHGSHAIDVSILTTTGQVVLDNRTRSEILTIDVSSLQKGIYFIKVKQEGKTTIRKVVVN